MPERFEQIPATPTNPLVSCLANPGLAFSMHGFDIGSAALDVRHTVGRTFLAPWNRSSRIAVVAFS